MDKRGKISEYAPTEDECLTACALCYPSWEEMSGEFQEKTLKDAKRWLLIWGHVLPEMSRY